jgi:flavorubredoxin
LEELGKKKAQGRKAFRFGSFGWSGGAQKELDEINERLKLNWSFIEPHEFKGRACEADLEIIRKRVAELIEML